MGPCQGLIQEWALLKTKRSVLLFFCRALVLLGATVAMVGHEWSWSKDLIEELASPKPTFTLDLLSDDKAHQCFLPS